MDEIEIVGTGIGGLGTGALGAWGLGKLLVGKHLKKIDNLEKDVAELKEKILLKEANDTNFHKDVEKLSEIVSGLTETMQEFNTNIALMNQRMDIFEKTK